MFFTIGTKYQADEHLRHLLISYVADAIAL